MSTDDAIKNLILASRTFNADPLVVFGFAYEIQTKTRHGHWFGKRCGAVLHHSITVQQRYCMRAQAQNSTDDEVQIWDCYRPAQLLHSTYQRVWVGRRL